MKHPSWSHHWVIHWGRTTTNRRGSTPSDSEDNPAAATASCTTFRSNGVIGSEGVEPRRFVVVLPGDGDNSP